MDFWPRAPAYLILIAIAHGYDSAPKGKLAPMPHFDPAPMALDEVISPQWLTKMLLQRWPDILVSEVKIVEVQATQATKVRLQLSIMGGDGTAPTDICIKGVLTDTGAVPSASIVETLFYRDAAAGLPVRVPDCLYVSLSDDGIRGVIVMRDVIAAGGMFCSALTPFTPDEAMDGLDQLARLHCAAWQGSAAFGFGWTFSFLDQISQRPIMPQAMLQDLLDGPRGEALNPMVRDAGRLQCALESLAAEVRSGPLCLVHGDAHAGNIYRDAGGALGLVDWQIVQKCHWAMDVAYHLASVLTVEDRRTHERALLAEYCARVHSLGGPEVGKEEAWRAYRIAAVYGYYLWAITRKVEPKIINTFMARLGGAVDDLDSFALLSA